MYLIDFSGSGDCILGFKTEKTQNFAQQQQQQHSIDEINYQFNEAPGHDSKW